MDFKVFYAEVVNWIYESNQRAAQYGLNNDEFWSWVAYSTGELCDKYGNNDLVKRQMGTLIDWLIDVFNKQTG